MEWNHGGITASNAFMFSGKSEGSCIIAPPKEEASQENHIEESDDTIS